ncbi:ovostatin-like isoform X1 [Bufo gargarizans]|uniref:ovostatin-like isoform X1 n=1 Tax=Bufo gargarizans TaxID=30331 RepID=UPI001CF29157|nr:ovostatin-like isoform X1 [Bufo gargarizans]
MGRLMLLLCAALLSLVTGARSDPNYVLSTPVQLVSGDAAKVCIHIVGITEPLAVSVVLEHDGRNTSIVEEDVTESKYFQCGEFKVPSVSKAVPVTITFSAIGSSTELRERKTVVINSASNNCMYQMDKPEYKPGQKVLFRLLCLNSQLKPVNEKFTAVYLQDASNTKIFQWLLPELNHGVISLEFQLTSGASLGTYELIAERESGYPISNWFTVKEYVIPRFKVEIEAPQTIAVTAESITYNVSGIYSFGEPVPGSVTVRFCKRPQFYGRQLNCVKDKGDSCVDTVGELSADGTYSGVFDLHSAFAGSPRERSMTLEITVTEADTGIQATETRYIWATSQPATVNFDYESLNQYYKRGIDYIVPGLLTDESNKPIPNQEIEVQINNDEPQKAITDEEGRFEYAIDTSNMVDVNFTARISYTNPDQCYFSQWSERDYPTAEHMVYRFYSYSGSFIQAKRPKGELSCGQSHSIDIAYIISPEGTGPEVNTATFNYLVLSRSAIVQSGQKDVDLSSSRNGSFSLDLPVSADMAPRADLVIYSLLGNEMIADTVSLNIEKCFRNQVSMTFSEEKVAPGSTVDIQLSADPNSYCALRVIDTSLLIMYPYEPFSADSIYNSVIFNPYGYRVADFDVEDPAPPCEDPDKLVFYNGRYYVPVSSTTEGDTYNILKAVGMAFRTSVRARKPEVCDKNPPGNVLPARGFGADPRFKTVSLESSAVSAPQETVRTNFSETFSWVMLTLDTEGRATLSETIPDSITKWQGTAFCTSEETGFGMTRNPATITTFLTFSMELSLPYSLLRDETLTVTGVVRNYMEQSIKVQATLENSNAFTAVLKDGQQDVCVAANGRTAYIWELQPNFVGEISITASAQTSHIGACDGPNDASQSPRKDTVVNTVIVEPNGIRQERTSSNLVFVENTNIQLPISITPPEDTVPGSITAYITAIGDIFGLSVQHLENQLLQPYGSGEQNIARMAVIPDVIDYLNSTGQLKEETFQKAKSLMLEGYYRQLSYTSGGAYLTFPNSREQVNSFVTAATFRTFEKCKQYIYIDEDRQQQTLIWLENSQRLKNGCFKAQGTLFTIPDTDTDRDVYFTSFMAIALMESKSNYSLGKTLLNGALECLKNASKSEQTISTKAIMLYALTLADLPEYREPLLQSVMRQAKTEGGTIHFERENMPTMKAVPFFFPQYPSLENEITSYVLLSYSAGPINQETLTTMGQMAIWLVRQQNSLGGFRCTKDTSIGLQALAAVGKQLYTPSAQQTVAVKRGNGEVSTLELNQDNRLVANRVPLPEATGDYSIEVSGSGWCMIQTTVGYNIPIPKENAAFSLSLSTSSDGCVNGVARSIIIKGSVSYNGPRNESNLAIVSIRPYSGYTVDFSSLYELREQKVILKSEQGPKGEVILYFETITEDPIDFSLRFLIGQRVLNVKTSSAVVYSYYQPDENGAASYSHPCVGATGLHEKMTCSKE